MQVGQEWVAVDGLKFLSDACRGPLGAHAPNRDKERSFTLKVPQRFSAGLHRLRIAGIEKTPPLHSVRSGLIYVGMVCHPDVRAWLVAVKSIATAVGNGEFCVVDDGSLTQADRSLLGRHLVGAHFVRLNEVENSGTPRGNCWERLLAILSWSNDRYAIQVDADLVARNPLPEVVEAVRANRSFTLAGEATTELKSVTAASEQARHADTKHIQWEAESHLADLPGREGLRYIRGCAGFAGFPNGCNRAHLTMLSQFMEKQLGARWSSWGSEQVASNFVIANARDPLVLPWHRYPAFGAVRDIANAALVHFIGSHRYDNGLFTRASLAAISRLNDGTRLAAL